MLEESSASSSGVDHHTSMQFGLQRSCWSRPVGLCFHESFSVFIAWIIWMVLLSLGNPGVKTGAAVGSSCQTSTAEGSRATLPRTFHTAW